MTGESETQVRVALQQHHQLFRTGLTLLLPANSAIKVIGSVSSPAELVGLCGRARPPAHVALVDGEPDPNSLATAILSLRRSYPTLSLVGLAERRGAVRSLRLAGCDAVVDRSADVASIVGTILHAAGRATPAPVTTRHKSRSVLSEREREVLALVGHGLTVRAISEQLSISAKTVEHHKRQIFEKLRTHNQAHAVSIGFRQGLLQGDRLGRL